MLAFLISSAERRRLLTFSHLISPKPGLLQFFPGRRGRIRDFGPEHFVIRGERESIVF